MPIRLPFIKRQKERRPRFALIFGLTLLILLLPVAFFALRSPSLSQAAWFDDSWSYRKRIPVSTHTAAETNVYLGITVDTAALTTDKLQADCDDLRFTKEDGQLLPYQIVSGCDTSTTSIRVGFDTMPVAPFAIYMYYGNPSALAGSSTLTHAACGNSCAVGTFGSEEKGTGPTSYWKFDEGVDNTCSGGSNDACDSVTTANDLSRTNATWKTEDLCLSGKCFYLDGSGDYLTRADADDRLDFAAADKFTISGWFRHPTISTNPDYLIAKHQATVAGGYKVYMDSDGDIAFGIDDDGTWDPEDVVGDDQSKNYDDNRWHHFAAVKDGTSGIYLYVDGVLIDSDTSLTATGTLGNNTAFYMGIDADGSSNSWDGFIDEIKIYRYVRSAAQVKSDFATKTSVEGVAASLGEGSKKFASDGLVGYWKLDESSGNAADSSGVGTSLTDTNTVAFVGGKFANAGDFEATNSEYQFAADNATLSLTGSLTLSAWIKPESVSSGTYNIIAKWDGSNESYRLYQSTNTIVLEVESGNTVTSSTTLSASSWYHVVGTYDSTTQTGRVYINGALDATSTSFPSSIGDDAGRFHIGAEDSSTTAANFYDGVIDDVRVYSRTFTASEISSLYTSGLSPIGHWNLDENTSTAANDRSGNSLNGTISTGGTTTVVSDTFTEASNTALTSHTPDIGTSWTQVYNTATSAVAQVNSADYLHSSASQNSVGITVTAQPAPSSVSQTITASVGWHGNQTENGSRGAHIIARRADGDNYYTVLMYPPARTGDSIELRKVVAGVDTLLGSYEATFNTTHTIKLEITDATKKVYVDDVERISSTDNALTSAGTWGVAWGTTEGDIGGHVNTNWRFDNMTFQETSASESVTWPPGRFGSSVRLDGTNDKISVSDNAILDFAADQSFTVSAWARHDGAISTNPDYLLTKADTTNGGYKLWMDNSGDFCFGVDDDSTWDPDASACTSGVDFDDSAWHHVAGIKNGTSSLLLYVDGVLRASTTSNIPTNTLANSNALYFGVDRDGSSNPWDGDIDEVKIYNYARTAAQVIEGMNGGHPIGGSPVGSQDIWYRMDEQQGSTVNNAISARSSLTGSISGATWKLQSDCKINGCLDFDGSDDAITVTNADPIDFDVGLSEGFTVTTWFYADSDGETDVGRIFQKGTSTYCRTDNQSGSNLDIECNLDLATTDANVNVSSAVTTGSWNHLALTYDGNTTIKVYINGMQRGSHSGSGATSADSDLVIGGTPNFDGKIDDFKVYAAELSPDQVKIDRSANAGINFGTGQLEASLLLDGAGNPPTSWWRFDENTGTSASDYGDKDNTLSFAGSNSNLSWVPGKVGAGVKNNASSNSGLSVTDPADGSLDFNATDSFTISLWARLPTTGVIHRLIQKGGFTSGEPAYRLRTSTGGIPSCGLHDGTTADNNTADTNVTDGNWHHIVCVRNGSTDAFQIYIDGVLEDNDTDNTSLSLENANAFEVFDPSGTVHAGDTVDNIKIFRYALTASQVVYEYNRGAPYKWWKLDECQATTAYNSTGNGNNGTITPGGSGNTAAGACGSGTSTEMWNDGTTGKRNGSLGFDGTNDYVDLGDVGITAHTNWSIAFWANKTSSAANPTVYSEGASGSWPNTMLSIYYGDTSESLGGGIRVWYGSTAATILSYATNLADSSWHHVVITQSSATDRKLYVDGKLVDTDTTNISPLSAASLNTASLGAGNNAGTREQFFEGQIDDVRIYTYDLSASQIRQIMNEGAVRFGPSTGSP